MDEASGATAADSSPGGGNDGTLTGQQRWDSDGGIFAGALEFDGSDDFVTIEAIPGFNDNKAGGSIDNYAVSLWFQPTDLPPSGTIQMVWEAGGNVVGNECLFVWATSWS